MIVFYKYTETITQHPVFVLHLLGVQDIFRTHIAAPAQVDDWLVRIGSAKIVTRLGTGK